MTLTAPRRSTPRTGLDALFEPDAIAVVGASRSPGKLGAALARSLEPFRDAGGRVALVNSRDDAFAPSVTAAAGDGPIDLAMLCVPAAACPAALRDAGRAGVRAAVICGGGFAETGDDGAAVQREVLTVAREHGIRLLGPNTSGFFVPRTGLTASFVPGAAALPAGRIAVLAASGGVNHAVSFLLADAGYGLSLGVGLGNCADITAADVLTHLAGDEHTAVVALHVESVSDGPALVEAVSRLSATRPVVALVVGRNDIGEFAASHTGALATSWRTTRAALAQAGAVLVDDERDLVDAVGALSVARAAPAAEPGVGVITAQAGPGLLLLDDLHGRGVAVPKLATATRETLAGILPPLTYQDNPVDTGRPGEDLCQVLAAVAADPGVDVLAGYALHEPGAVDLTTAVAGLRAPMVFGVGGAGAEVAGVRAALRAAGIAVTSDVRGVATAIDALCADARARHRPPAVPAQPVAATVPSGQIDEDRAKTLLNALGFATPGRAACDSRAEAHAALAALGGPVAVKLLDAAVLHKTELGGVHLGVRTAGELDAALDALETAGAQRFLVEAMAPDGVDLVAGARRDPVFGPVVLLGLGGTVAEALADVTVRLAPAHPAELAAMPADLAGRALLDGWRGGPVLDTGELARLLGALGTLLTEHEHLAEVEVNPLRLTAGGLLALDAVVVTEPVSTESVTTGEVTDAQPDQ